MNVLKPEKRAAMITLLKKDISQREISRKAGIDRKTIRKYLRQNDLGSTQGDDFLVCVDVVATGLFSGHRKYSVPCGPIPLWCSLITFP